MPMLFLYVPLFFVLVFLAPDMTLLEAMEGPPLADDPCICEPWLGYRCPNLDNGLQGLAGPKYG